MSGLKRWGPWATGIGVIWFAYVLAYPRQSIIVAVLSALIIILYTWSPNVIGK